MASFTGQTIATTYKRILTIDSENFAANDSAKYIKDGDAGTISALSLSTNRVGIGTESPASILHIEDDTAQYLRFAPYGSYSFEYISSAEHRFSVAERSSKLVAMTINESGYVGIGDSTPAGLLEVKTSGGTIPGVLIDCSAGHSTTACIIKGNDTTDAALEVGQQGGGDILRVWDGAVGSGAEVFTILDGGNVGIGTTTPGTLLSIKGASVAHSTNVHAQLNILDTAAFGAYPKAGIAFQGYTTGTTAFTMGGIYMVKENTTENNESSMMRFLTRKEGSYPAINMVIDEDGNVGIGMASPVAVLDVGGSSSSGKSLQLRSGDTGSGTDSTQIIFSYSGRAYNDAAGGYAHSIKTRHNGGGENGNAIDFYTHHYGTDGIDALGTRRVMTIDGTGNVGIGTVSPTANLHIDQSSATGAKPVLSLDQADISDGFINFIGTSAGSTAGPISTLTTAGSLGGFVRVEINGTQKWMPFYGDPS